MALVATGLAGIDDCVGASACNVNGCAHGCNTNDLFYSWPHFHECGSVHCQLQTDVPSPGASPGCESSEFTFTNHCTGRAALPTLFECGPCPATRSGGYCPNGSLPVIACLNIALFTYLCAGCNPLTYGFIRIRVTD